MKKQKLIVISMDALIYEDLEHLCKKPSFKLMLENGSLVKRVKSIYPTLTYPCHTTMATGCYPEKHGITKNVYNETVLNPTWMFEHKNVLCEDIFDACKRAGLTTAAVGWPVTGNHKNIDYLVNECWPESGSPIEKYAEKYLEQGTPKWLLEEAVLPHLWLRYGRRQPQSSYFLSLISTDIIRKYQPDLLMLHLAVVDHFRHVTGVFSEQVNHGLDTCEEMLSLLINATKDAGIFENTNFVVTADHGHLNCSRRINPNYIFAHEGLIETDENGNAKSWKAWSYSTGMSAQVHLCTDADKALYDKVYTLLKNKRDEGVWGISEVYTKEECKKMHLDGDFSFVIEGDGYTEFGNGLEELIKTMPLRTAGHIFGDHGFHPDKGPRPPFLASGPAFKNGVVLEHARLADGAPTYAKILGASLPEANGKVLNEILK